MIHLYTVCHIQHLPGFYRRRVHPSEAFRASTSDSSLSSSKSSPQLRQLRMEADEAAIKAAAMPKPMGSPSKFFKTHDMYYISMSCMSCMSCMSYTTCHTYVSIWMYLWQAHDTNIYFPRTASTFLYWKYLEVVRSCMNGSKVTVVLI